MKPTRARAFDRPAHAGAAQSYRRCGGGHSDYREILTDDANNATALNNLAYTLVTADPPIYAPAEASKYAERLRVRAEQ